MSLKLFCVLLSFHNHFSGSPIPGIILLPLFTVPFFVPNPQLCEYIRSLYENRPIKELFKESLKTSLVFHVKYHIAVIDNGAKAIVGERIEKNTNKTLVQLLIQAFNISHDILQGKQVKDLCEKYQLTDRYMRKILTLRFLPAELILSILDGTQGREITAKQLFEQASQHK